MTQSEEQTIDQKTKTKTTTMKTQWQSKKTKRKKESDKSRNREETIVKMIENTCWIDMYMLVKAEYPKPVDVESTYIRTIMQTQKGEKSRYIFITIYCLLYRRKHSKLRS